MIAIKRLVLCMTFLVLALASQVSFAGELLVRHSVLLAESDGGVVQGTVEVFVRNQTSGDIYNVDLRVNHPGVYSINKHNLLQLGSIPVGDARVHLASFMFSEEFFASKEPIIWSIDYDDAAGQHEKIEVSSIQEVK
ncbi:MAG: hypothetical protein O6948_05970 [Deltaproteobacteria bacterium]|nr:hypothetical protein [Deltaproteobacteria bacterium]